MIGVNVEKEIEVGVANSVIMGSTVDWVELVGEGEIVFVIPVLIGFMIEDEVICCVIEYVTSEVGFLFCVHAVNRKNNPEKSNILIFTGDFKYILVFPNIVIKDTN